MKRFIEGEDRTQVTLLPECLDDFVESENPVRVIEVFVDELDLGALGFIGVDPAATGRPAHHPATRASFQAADVVSLPSALAKALAIVPLFLCGS